MRSFLLFSAALLAVLCGCGGSSPEQVARGTVAMVGSTRITAAQLERYVDYAQRYYASAYAQGNPPPASPCKKSRTAACRTLRDQVLRRLIEEAVILRYARSHGIALSSSDRSQVAAQLAELSTTDTPSARLLLLGKAPTRFITTLLSNERVVQKVEEQVGGKRAREGRAFRLTTFRIPLLNRKRTTVFREALNLATDGKPVPPNTRSRTRWIADFRLPKVLKAAVRTSDPGQFIGPFKVAGGYLVAQLVSSGIHRYGRPARSLLQMRYFTLWLDRQLKAAKPRCFGANEVARHCPAGKY